jgi:hypothetical protein
MRLLSKDEIFRAMEGEAMLNIGPKKTNPKAEALARATGTHLTICEHIVYLEESIEWLKAQLANRRIDAGTFGQPETATAKPATEKR